MLGAFSVTPSAGTTVTARSLIDNNVFIPVDFVGGGIFPNEFAARFPFGRYPVDVATGGFVITAENGGDQDQVTTHSIAGVQPIAFVGNVNMTGDPLAPTVFWTLPTATAPFDMINVRVLEFGPGPNFSIISSFTSPALPPTATTYPIPSGVLKPNSNRQAIWIRLNEMSNGVVVNRSEVRVPYSTAAVVTHRLTVTRTGDGTVTSSPAGIDCGAACGASYPEGTSVTLTATPAPGSLFAG